MMPASGAPPSDQRRHLAILFSDLCDSTRIAATMEPESYGVLLQALRDIAYDEVPRHGGEIVRVDGDGMLAIFGYPEPHEDDARRATEAAIGIHDRVRLLEQEEAFAGIATRMHSGVHAGVVLLRTGDMVRGRYELLGDATNVAARLCDAAGTDGIVVSESALGGDRHRFKTGARRSLCVSGHAQAIAVFDVLARAAAPTRLGARDPSGLTPFAGRGEERARLHAWLVGNGASGREPGIAIPVMLLHGPAGIGKSRFVDQIADNARGNGWRVIHSYCESYLSARPLQPFLQIAEALGVLRVGTDVDSVASSIQARLTSAITASPVLLIIDDWQWADDASRTIAAFLLHAFVGVPRLRILLASRTSDSGLPRDQIDRYVATTALPPLDPTASHRTIAALLPTPGPFTIARIEAAAGGSPLLIEELCHALQASGLDDPSSLLSESKGRGAWYDLAVQTRFAALDPADAALLRLAAVIGHMVPTAQLASVLGAPIDAAQLGRLRDADFLYPGEREEVLRFKHGLTRDAVYAGIGLAERRALHTRVLDALTAEAAVNGDDAVLDALAYHSAAANRRDLALPYAIRAGDQALAAGALDRAQAHYRVGFGLVDRLTDTNDRRDQSWALLNKFGIASLVDPSPDQINELARLSALFRDRGDVPGMIRAAYWQGAIAYGIGACKRSVAHLNEALVLATEHNQPRFIDQIRTKLAQSLFASGQYQAAAELFTSVLPDIRKCAGRNDREALAYALASFGFMMADIGDFEMSDALYAEQESVEESAAVPVLASILGQKSAISLWRGDWHAASELAAVNLRNSTQTRARYQTMMGHALDAYARWQIDRRDEAAVEALQAACRWFLADGSSSQRTSLVHGWLADVMAARGDRLATRRYVAHAVQRVRYGGDRLGEGMAWRALARVEQRSGHDVRADHYCRMAERSAAIRGSRREQAEALLCRAEIATLRGDHAAAQAFAGQAASMFEAMGVPHRAACALPYLTSR